jgi:photosystem II stability/assembly factor-like uncharacterized protein
VTGIPSPYDNAYYLDIYFLENNPNYGWACGKNGIVIRTTDGGEKWDYAIIPYAYQLESIHFVNEKVGYTSGLVSGSTSSGGVFKSIDGGKSWTNVSPAGQIDVWGTFFLDENTGLSIGGGCGTASQQFYRTTNGGKNWIGFYRNMWDTGLSDLIIDKNTGVGYASSSGVIWITLDYGKTWDFFAQTGTNDWQEEITLVGKTFLLPYSTGCTGGDGGGGARISTDMGQTWRQKSFATPMFGSYLFNEKSGWVVGWRRSCYFTSDAGVTWENKNCGITQGADLDDIWFINDTLGFVVGVGVYKYVGFNPPNPEIQADGTFPACYGDTVTLFSKGYYEYFKWSTGETTPSIKVTKAGTYTLWAANNECDSATSKPFIVTFYPKTDLLLKLSDTTNLCEGDTVSITLSGKFNSINWSTGETSSEIIVQKSGRYSVSVVDSNGCVISDSVEIAFAPIPEALVDVIGKTDFCVGDSVWLASHFDYPKYEWYKDNETNPFSKEKSVFIKESGEYRLFVWNTNGCFSISNPVKVLVRLDTNVFDFTISAVQEFSLDSVKFPAITCKKIKLKSKSWKTQTIDNIYLYINKSFSIPQSYLPIVLEPYGEFEFEVCYSPRKMDWEKDTLFINDRCEPHILPLIAKGIPNSYSSESKCDIPLEFKTIDILDYGEIFEGPPYPNPTGGIIQVPLKLFYYDQEPIYEIYLTDMMQNMKFVPSLENVSMNEVDSKVNSSGSKDRKVKIKSLNAKFDVSSLSNGVYFIILKSNTSKVYKIIINK